MTLIDVKIILFMLHWLCGYWFSGITE